MCQVDKFGIMYAMSNETKDVVKPIIHKLMDMGIPAYRMNSGSFKLATGGFVAGHAPGTPDIMAARPSPHGFLLGWIECKTGRGALSWVQIKFLREAHKKCIPWLVATSLECVDRWLSDVSYHGAERLIRPVVDPTYEYEFKTSSRTTSRPSPYDALIEAGHARIAKERAEASLPPF